MINELEALYSSIHSGSMQSIVNGHETIDPLLNARENDTRFGITLLIPLGTSIASEISSIRDEIRKIEPGQYFYPASDLHVTVLDLQSAHESFQRDNERIEESIRLIEMAIPGIAQFDIDFRGIIFSNAGILLKGYYYNGLETIRTRIRERAAAEGITLQERYRSISAHATFVRFRSTLQNRRQLSAYVQKATGRAIGTMTVREMHLVIHDWYNRRKEVVGRFSLLQRPMKQTGDGKS